MDMTSLRHRIALVTLLGLMAIPVFAQGRNEIGVIGLVTSYRKVNVTGPERSGTPPSARLTYSSTSIDQRTRISLRSVRASS